MKAEAQGPIGFVFIDADKSRDADDIDAALAMTRPGASIVVDDVVRRGAVADDTSHDVAVPGVRRLAERIAGEPRATATVLQAAGSTGYDGLLVARADET